jgi:serine/threonine protein kinase
LINASGRALVTDIGLSTMLDDVAESGFDGNRPGTLRWTAPELLSERDEYRLPTSKSDVWSFACNMIHVNASIHPH